MFKEVLSDFVIDKLGTYIITDETGSIVYKGGRLDLSEKTMAAFNRIRPETDAYEEWELIDKETGRFYQICSAGIERDGKHLQCHAFNNVTVYSELMQEINAYSKQIEDEKKFQDKMMKKLTLSYDSCLAELVSFCKAAQGVLFMESEERNCMYKSTFISVLCRNKIKATPDMEPFLDGEGVFDDEDYLCYLTGTASKLRFALYLEKTPYFSKTNFDNATVRNVVSLFIENSILRQKHIYASEHDKLTGLYNKGKYMALKSESFGKPEQIAVFNMDVNNLKKINDSMGHEAGDNLIIKASDSINAIITSDNILGFRVGGDEFVVVAKDVSEEEANEILKAWRNTLNILNAKNDGITITVACGLVWAKGDYDIEEVLKNADERMYKNKKEIKSILA